MQIQMPVQLSLLSPSPPRGTVSPGWRPGPVRATPTPPSIVYYFAVRPPEEICLALTRLGRDTAMRERLIGRPKALDHLHIAVAPLLSCSPSDDLDCADTLEPLAEEITSRVTMSPFRVSFDSLETFMNKGKEGKSAEYPLVLRGSDLPGLLRLNSLFRLSRIRSGLDTAMSAAFNPHVTLFYGNHPIAPRDIAPIRWTVDEFMLVRSVRGGARSQRMILKRWPLVHD